MPPTITVTIVLPVGLGRAWAKAADLPDHVTWMADAERIDFLTEERAGPGVVMSVLTRVGPFSTRDRIEVTHWEPPRRIAVAHRGLVRGSGEFLLEAIDDASTRFTWQERLRFPWYLGGPVTAWLARPVLAWIWRRNLRRLHAQLAA